MKKMLLCLVTALAVSPAMNGQLLAPSRPGNASTAYNSPLGVTAKTNPPGHKARVSVDSRTTADPSRIMRRATDAVPEPGLQLWGVVGYSDHNEEGTMNAHRGFYLISGEGRFTKLDAIDIPYARSSNYGTTLIGRDYYLYYTPKFEIWSTKSWTNTGTIAVGKGFSSFATAYWAPDGLVYASKKDGTTFKLVTQNYELGTETEIATLETLWFAMAFDKDGTLWGLDSSCSIWKATREDTITKVHDKVIPCEMPDYFNSISSAVIDNSNNTMIASILGNNTDLEAADDNGLTAGLYRIDLATGKATLLVHWTYNDEVLGLAFPLGTTPGIPADMAAPELDFGSGSLTGNVSFTLPSETTDGSAGDGELTYTVYVAGKKAASGTGAWGSSQNVSVTAPTSGYNYFYVECSSTAGKGIGAGKWMFTGKDAPVAPSSVNAHFMAGGSMVMVTWSKVTESVNGGYINPDEVTYTLRRYTGPDDTEGEIWKENISITSEARPMAEPDQITDYTWGVTATYDGKTSAETRSNALRSGYVTPPWTYDFSNEADIFNTFTRINNNSDTESWKYYSSGWGANKNGMVSVRLNKSQATGEDWDKWLVSPNVKLIPGKAYRFNVKVKDQSNSTTSPHRVEVKLGTSSSDMETMTLDIVPQQDVTGTTWKTLEGYIRVDTENKYFVGIHVCTPANNGVAVSRTIYFDDFTIGLPQESSTPGQVADFSVTPAADGSHSATISFKAPSTDFAGQNPLASLDKVDIYRGEELIKTFEHPSFGQQLEYIDNTPSFGEYTYRVVGSNENGEGNAMSATVFVGVKLAASPENVTVFQTSNPGEVTLSWTPPTKDIDGGLLPAGGVTGYSVVELLGSAQNWLQDVDASVNSVTFRAIEADAAQDFKRYAVFPITESGTGRGRASEIIVVGNPDQLPWSESFNDAEFHHNYMIEGTGGNWFLFKDEDLSGLSDCDGNNGFIGMQAEFIDDWSALVTGRISLAGTTNPYLTFNTYNIVNSLGTPDQNKLEVFVVAPGEEVKCVKTIVMADDCAQQGWNRFLVDLSEWAGRDIQLKFQATAVNLQYTFIDAVKVNEARAHDLTALSITAPEKIRANEEFKVRVKLENSGSSTEGDYSINLMRNGQPEVTAQGRTVHPTETMWVDIPVTVGVINEGPQEFKAEIVLATDEYTDDNMTGTAISKLVLPKLPVVNNPVATTDGNGSVELQWEKPTIDRTPRRITDTMEAYEGGTSECDEWIIIDGDEMPVLGFEDFRMPGVPSGSKRSWFVIDESDPAFGDIDSFYAHSGNKSLGFFGVDGTCADWIISPQLSGQAQQVSLWLRAYHPYVSETVEFLISGESNNPWNFTRVATYDLIGADWTEYIINLPAGARYFAIKGATASGLLGMLDDVSYIPLGNSAVNHRGYNIYRDGVRLNESPLRKPAFSHAVSGDAVGSVYRLTAVYDEGESIPVDVTVTQAAALGMTSAPSVAIAGGRGKITVTGAEGLEVIIVSPDGKIVYSGIASDNNLSVSIANPGIYIAKAGTTAAKVTVR